MLVDEIAKITGRVYPGGRAREQGADSGETDAPVTLR
jgi:hypothetical protein